MICPKCKLPMYFFGVTEKGEDKYFCSECKNTEIIDDKVKIVNE